MSRHIEASYTNDAEWLMIASTTFDGTAMSTIEPQYQDRASAVSPTATSYDSSSETGQPGWVRTSSEHGNFTISAPLQPDTPNDFSLQDWTLTFEGLPRAYHRLNREVISDIFGQEGMNILDEIYHGTRSNHESIGDLRALHREEGVLPNLEDVQDKLQSMLHVTRELPYDINEKTREKRQAFLAQAIRQTEAYAGRLVIPRSVLITE